MSPFLSDTGIPIVLLVGSDAPLKMSAVFDQASARDSDVVEVIADADGPRASSMDAAHAGLRCTVDVPRKVVLNVSTVLRQRNRERDVEVTGVGVVDLDDLLLNLPRYREVPLLIVGEHPLRDPDSLRKHGLCFPALHADLLKLLRGHLRLPFLRA